MQTNTAFPPFALITAGTIRIRMTVLRALRMVALIGVATFLPLAFCASAHEEEAMAATLAACDAIRLRDIPALERLLAPDFNLVP